MFFCHQPVQPQHYYGSNFGYIVAFKPFDNKEWRKVMVADPLARSYIHKDLTVPPLTKFQVKVKSFNSKGEGPYSLTAVVYSAQDGESGAESQLSPPQMGGVHLLLFPLGRILRHPSFHLTLSVLLGAGIVAAVRFI